MSILAIELNDAGITALGSGDPSTAGRLVSPGYAVVDGSTVRTGVEALDQARLKPRRAHHRFWSELDTSPIGRPFPAGLSTADLAHAHLSAVWRRVGAGIDRVVVALPGSHSRHQMGLILGIARACGIPVEGLVDAAVASASTVSPNGQVLHLDLELNGIVLTELTGDRELVRRRVRVGNPTGLVPLYDAWVRRIADSFVSRTRFDPLHLAATEQALHRRLRELLPRLRRVSRVVVEMEAGGRLHGVEVDRADLEQAVAGAYDGLRQLVLESMPAGRAATVLLSDRVAGLPGFEARLGEVADARIVGLSPAAAAAGALGNFDAIRSPGEAPAYVTRLTLADPATESEAGAPRPPARRPAAALPTHVLHGDRAWPITERPLAVGTAVAGTGRGLQLSGPAEGVSGVHCSVYRAAGRVVVEDHSAEGSFVNGRRVAGRTSVECGDRLRLGNPGIELRLITVTDDDAAPRD